MYRGLVSGRRGWEGGRGTEDEDNRSLYRTKRRVVNLRGPSNLYIHNLTLYNLYIHNLTFKVLFHLTEEQVGNLLGWDILVRIGVRVTSYVADSS